MGAKKENPFFTGRVILSQICRPVNSYFIKSEEIYNDNKICAFGCQIFDDKQEEIACATINAYQPDNIEEILNADD